MIHCVTEPVVPLLSLTDAAAPGPDEAVLGLHAVTVRAAPDGLALTAPTTGDPALNRRASPSMGFQKALDFLHTTGQLLHNNVTLAAVFVAPGTRPVEGRRRLVCLTRPRAPPFTQTGRGGWAGSSLPCHSRRRLLKRCVTCAPPSMWTCRQQPRWPTTMRTTRYTAPPRAGPPRAATPRAVPRRAVPPRATPPRAVPPRAAPLAPHPNPSHFSQATHPIASEPPILASHALAS